MLLVIIIIIIIIIIIMITIIIIIIYSCIFHVERRQTSKIIYKNIPKSLEFKLPKNLPKINLKITNHLLYIVHSIFYNQSPSTSFQITSGRFILLRTKAMKEEEDQEAKIEAATQDMDEWVHTLLHVYITSDGVPVMSQHLNTNTK